MQHFVRITTLAIDSNGTEMDEIYDKEFKRIF